MGNFQCLPAYEKNKLPCHMFKVKNIDDTGREVGRGLIEVNKTDLVFYQRGHEAIRWPLMSLRRYGFDTTLFSFESGRRCATGPGLYAFKCKKAEHLFNLVKENAQHCGEEARNTSRTSAESVWTHPRSSRPPSANGSLPRANGTIQHHSPISIRSTNSHHSGSPHSGNLSPAAPMTPVYQNGDVVARTANGLAPMVQYVNTVDIPELETAPTSIRITVPYTPNTSETRATIQLDDDSNNYIDDDSLVNYASLHLNRDEELQITEQQVVTRDENGNKPIEPEQESVNLDVVKEDENPDSNSDVSEEDIVNGNIELGQELNRNGNASTDESSSEMTLQEDEQDSDMNVTQSPTHSHKETTPTRTSPSTYYANLDTVGELPQHPYNFTFYSDLRTPRSTSSRSSMGSEFTFETNGANNNSRSPSASEHSYANLDTLTELARTSVPSSSRSRTNSSPAGSMVLEPPPKGKVNYIQLDMETLGSLAKQRPANRQTRSYSVTSSPPKTPSSADIGNRTESYATIDFDRTNALASANSTSALPPNGAGGRRTRHDSRTTDLL